MMVTAGAVLAMLWVIAGRLIDPSRSIAGWTSVMVVVLFLGGVQLLSIGLLGEYIARIFRQAKGRPLYVVARRVNFAHGSDDAERNTNSLSSANESTAHGGAASTPAR